MSSRFVSIGMPVYNGGEALRRALDCLLAQTHANFELIISDNASTDTVTQAITEEYARRDSRIRLTRHLTNQGAIANFLWVVEQAEGEYFMWAAHDDGWSNNYVATLSRRLDEVPEAMLATPSTTLEKTSKTGTKVKRVLPPAPNGDQWATLDVFIKDAGCEWIYGMYRTAWLKTATPDWTQYPLNLGDMIWLYGLLLQVRVVGEAEAMFFYTNAHKNKVRSYNRIELWSKLIYHLTRLTWQRLPAPERLRGFRRAWRLVYRFHIYRRGVIGTSANILKLAVLWLWFGLETGVRRLVRPRCSNH